MGACSRSPVVPAAGAAVLPPAIPQQVLAAPGRAGNRRCLDIGGEKQDEKQNLQENRVQKACLSGEGVAPRSATGACNQVCDRGVQPAVQPRRATAVGKRNVQPGNATGLCSPGVQRGCATLTGGRVVCGVDGGGPQPSWRGSGPSALGPWDEGEQVLSPPCCQH